MNRKRAKRGDVFAIPYKAGDGFVLGVVVANNSFGTAYLLVNKVFEALPSSIDAFSPILKYPIYSDEKSIKNERWQYLFHDEDILLEYQTAPEIFHSPKYNPQYGPYGLGETPDGEIRNLSKAEADELGLLSGDYSQALTSEEIEQFIALKIVNG